MNIKTIFDEELKHVDINSSMFDAIHRYVKAFIHKNDEHVGFFGTNLTGVYTVRFLPADRMYWVVDILDIDDEQIFKRIIKLPTVKETWVRGTDVMNLSCLYLVHRIYNSGYPQDVKRNAMFDVLMAMHVKLISSLMAWYFKYPADEATAKATYAALSKKFSLKQYGSWYGLLQDRCNDILSTNSIHRRTISNFDSDAGIQYMITDIQGRLKSIVKNLWEVFEQIRNQNAKISTISGTVEMDGELHIRDLERKQPKYLNYIQDMASNEVDFIKPTLFGVLTANMNDVPLKPLELCLKRLVEMQKKRDPKIKKLLDEVVIHSFTEIARHKDINRAMRNLPELIPRLRNLYMASRSSDPSVLYMREIGTELVAASVNIKTPSTLATLRTSVLIYIVLRTYTMQHFLGGA